MTQREIAVRLLVFILLKTLQFISQQEAIYKWLFKKDN